MYEYTRRSTFGQLGEPRSTGPQKQQAHAEPRLWFLTLLSSQGNQGSLEKQMILGLGQETQKISLGHFVVPASK